MRLRDRNLLWYHTELAMNPSSNRIQGPTPSHATRMDELLSVSQFAAMAKVTPQAVRKMIAEGRLRAAKVGQQHVIVREELSRYLSERR